MRSKVDACGVDEGKDGPTTVQWDLCRMERKLHWTGGRADGAGPSLNAHTNAGYEALGEAIDLAPFLEAIATPIARR